MAFLNEWKDRLSKIAQNTASKTKDSVEIVRLNTEVRSVNGELNGLYEKIGRIFVESQGQDYDGLSPHVARVLELKDHLEEIQGRRLRLKKQYPCPVCGAVVSRGAHFCSGCGRRLIEPEAAGDDQVISRNIVAEPVEAPESFDAE